MGLLDMFKKKQAPAAPEAVVLTSSIQPEKKEPKICLDEEVLMEGIPRDFDESDDNEAYWDALCEIEENWDEDPEGSFAKMMTLAQAGGASAMHWVAEAYETGNGVPRDDEEYHRWLWRCMYAGESAGYMGAAGCYVYGDEIVSQDVVKAFELYLEANRRDDEFDSGKIDIEAIISSITEGTFADIYHGTPQEALEIVEMYKKSLG